MPGRKVLFELLGGADMRMHGENKQMDDADRESKGSRRLFTDVP